MGRGMRGALPCLLQLVQALFCDGPFADDKLFKCIEPMRIIGLARIGIALGLCQFDFVRQSRSPFRPSE